MTAGPMKHLAPAILALFLLAPAAQAASFDCAQASTEIEHRICGDAELSALDETLGDRYVRALAKADDPRAVKTGQRAWLRGPRDACADATCMKAAYAARIADLTKIGWITEEKAKAICERVAAAKLDGSYHGAFRRLDQGEVFEIDPGPGMAGYSPGGGGLVIDYDGDGKLEKLGWTGPPSRGTCLAYSDFDMIVDITEGLPEPDYYEDKLTPEMGRQVFLVVDGEPILARGQSSPYLDWLTPAGGAMPLCGIGIKRERRLKTVKSESPALCRAVAGNAVDFLPWSPVPEETGKKSAAGFDVGTRISSMSLDIDADGEDDQIAWVVYSSSAGCGYNHQWLVEMSPDLMSVTESPLNSVLIDKGPHIGAYGRWREWAPSAGSPHAGWDSPRIFMYDGKPYILGRAGSGGTAVISVWGGTERTWCEYSYPALPVSSSIRHYTIQPPSGE